jgi:MYXO-CTERM domain-containing protein
MNMMRFSPLRLAISAGAVTAMLAAHAQAQNCGADADCPKGFTCEETAVPTCVDVPPCAEGEACPARQPECSSEPSHSCVSIDCSSDSDCADDMACETVTTRDCAQTTCPADGDCPKVETSCEAETRNYCVPKYMLPCSADSDCGAGFSCVERESCGCSGGGGSSEPSPGGAPPDGGGSDSFAPIDPDADPAEVPPSDGSGEDPAQRPADDGSCSCEPSGEFACVVDRVACASDADCAAGFTCEDNPEGVCWQSSDGDSGCTEPDPPKLCMPPYTDLYGGVGRSEGGLAGQPESPAGDAASGSGDSNTAGESDGDDNAASGSGKSNSGGCSVAAAGGSAPWGLTALGLLGAVGLRRRRSA